MKLPGRIHCESEHLAGRSSTDKCVPRPDLKQQTTKALHTGEVGFMSIIHAKRSLYISTPLYFSFDENFKLWFDGGGGQPQTQTT